MIDSVQVSSWKIQGKIQAEFATDRNSIYNGYARNTPIPYLRANKSHKMPTIVDQKDFEPHCRAAFDDLRAALIELFASVGADPASPQEAARRFRVNKTLTWNISKVVSSSDPIATLPNVPGASALRSLLTAVQREGASIEVVERVRTAVTALDKMVERHVGDRATLELIVDGISPSRGDHLELSRKLAFRGNSGLWGVQAKTRLMTVMMAPNADNPDRIDMAIVRGYIGFRRLRSDVRWPIFQIRGWGEEGERVTEPWKPLETPAPGPEEEFSRLPLIRQFSNVAPTDVEEVQTNKGTDYMLLPGPIGNTGAIDCFIGDYDRSTAGKYRTEKDTTGEFGATISAPTERLIFDLIVHEELDFALRPEVRAFAGIFTERSEETLPEGYLPVPVPQNVSPLPGRPPVVTTPGVPRYTEIVNFVHERMGWNGERFRGCRLDLSYPPMGSTILLRFKLPKPPEPAAA